MSTEHIHIKQKLHEYCIEFIQKKHMDLLESIENTKQSLNSESQSTAGDKHDTSRAMMHLEIEKKSHQLTEIEKAKRVINLITPSVNTDSNNLGLGSVVITNNGSFYMAINAGKAKIDGKEFQVISLASPLAQAIKKIYPGLSLHFMNKKYEILQVY